MAKWVTVTKLGFGGISMSKNISIIQETELSTGTQIYVQISSTRASISIDGKDTGMTVWFTVEELDDLRKIITNALGELGDVLGHQE